MGRNGLTAALILLVASSLWGCKKSSKTKGNGDKTSPGASAAGYGDGAGGETPQHSKQSTLPLAALDYQGACTVFTAGKKDYCYEGYLDRTLGYRDYLNPQKMCDFISNPTFTKDKESKWSSTEKCEGRFQKGCRVSLDAGVTVTWYFLTPKPCEPPGVESLGF